MNEAMSSPFGNFMSSLKNFTMVPFYGATNHDNVFTLQPEGVADAGYIYVITHCKQDSNFIMAPTQLEMQYYSPPRPGEPVYIEEFSLLLFASLEERQKAFEKHGSFRKLISSYAAGTVPLINGNYVVTTCLNMDRTYYTLSSNNSIVELPREKSDYIRECMRKYNVSQETLDLYDVFLTNRIIRSGDGKAKDTVVDTKMEKIDRNTIKNGQPIIFSNNGFVVFNTKESAEAFVNTYGNLGNYLIEKALETTHAIHSQEIDSLNAKAKNDKKGIVETFALMGGTSVVSILAEYLVKSSMDGESGEETFKKAIKIFAIGAIGVGAVYGGYKLYRHYDAKKKAEAAARKK